MGHYVLMQNYCIVFFIFSLQHSISILFYKLFITTDNSFSFMLMLILSLTVLYDECKVKSFCVFFSTILFEFSSLFFMVGSSSFPSNYIFNVLVFIDQQRIMNKTRFCHTCDMSLVIPCFTLHTNI